MDVSEPVARLLTQAEASRRTGLPIGRIRSLIETGKLNQIKSPAGGYASVTEASVDRLLGEIRKAQAQAS